MAFQRLPYFDIWHILKNWWAGGTKCHQRQAVINAEWLHEAATQEKNK